MRLRGVKSIVDARVGQQRVIVHLACGHNISVSELDIAAKPDMLRLLYENREMMCRFCPDPPPVSPEEMDPLEAFRIASGGKDDRNADEE